MRKDPPEIVALRKIAKHLDALGIPEINWLIARLEAERKKRTAAAFATVQVNAAVEELKRDEEKHA